MSVDQRLNWLSVNRGHLRLLLDIILLGGLLLLSRNVRRLSGAATKRGFFCDDESLMYPYKENTVTSSMLHWISLYLPVAALVIIDTYRCWRRVAGGNCRWQQFWPVFNTVRWFLFGHVVEQFIKDMGKQVIGRLRPHFFDVCRPQLADGGTCLDEAHRHGGIYHMDYTCHSADATPEMLRDMNVSFPSGHSSMAFYGLVFMALYLQSIRLSPSSTLLRPLCQLVCVALATFVGLSRVMDYKHHWSDVVAGSLLGASVALAVVRGAAQQHRLHLQAATAKGPQSAAVASGGNVEAVAVATATATATEQLPHDLCEVTCHSSN
ncbi:putative phosphatidate phosphatase [Drosophila albomicans]|uniref:Phosphatidate phosphatase n=1 Tax=Drosophila albomicans TaxID=7291 RepID=A0A6P8WK61_DROAB|nr:putative phosphatidate phosphatase [Drosophila albomicans]